MLFHLLLIFCFSLQCSEDTFEQAPLITNHLSPSLAYDYSASSQEETPPPAYTPFYNPSLALQSSAPTIPAYTEPPPPYPHPQRCMQSNANPSSSHSLEASTDQARTPPAGYRPLVSLTTEARPLAFPASIHFTLRPCSFLNQYISLNLTQVPPILSLINKASEDLSYPYTRKNLALLPETYSVLTKIWSTMQVYRSAPISNPPLVMFIYPGGLNQFSCSDECNMLFFTDTPGAISRMTAYKSDDCLATFPVSNSFHLQLSTSESCFAHLVNKRTARGAFSERFTLNKTFWTARFPCMSCLWAC